MRTAIYCRVSTDDQEKEGTSLQTQREACVAYCQQKGYEVVRQFAETYSGLTLERPRLIELRELIRTNDIDVIVVYCLDRLSRDPAHGAMLFQQLEEHDVVLEAVTETIENTDMGKLISYIRGFASKVETEKIRERTMRGKIARLKEGKLPHGTGKGIYGYDWHPDTGRRTVNNLEAKVVQRIFTMVLQGSSFHKIAVELNKASIKSKTGSLWHPLTIRRIATNETYTGRTYSGRTKRAGKTKVIVTPEKDWFLLPDETPLIIDEDTFRQAQDTIERNKQARPLRTHAAYLLTGFARCPKCGSLLGGTTLNGKYRYYQCRGARPTTTRGKICDEGYIKADMLDESVYRAVVDLVTNPQSVLKTVIKEKQQSTDEVVTLLNKQIEQLRKKLKAYPAKEKNLYYLLSDDSVTKDYVLDAVKKIKQEQVEDKNQLERLLESRKESTQADRLRVRLNTLSFQELIKLLGEIDSSDLDDPGDPEAKHEETSVILARKRALFESLRLKVVANQKTFWLTIVLNGELVSIEDYDKAITFRDDLRNFEVKHPDVTVSEILETDLSRAGYSPLVQKVTKLKQDLVTIEQTSA